MILTVGYFALLSVGPLSFFVLSLLKMGFDLYCFRMIGSKADVFTYAYQMECSKILTPMLVLLVRLASEYDWSKTS